MITFVGLDANVQPPAETSTVVKDLTEGTTGTGTAIDTLTSTGGWTDSVSGLSVTSLTVDETFTIALGETFFSALNSFLQEEWWFLSRPTLLLVGDGPHGPWVVQAPPP